MLRGTAAARGGFPAQVCSHYAVDAHMVMILCVHENTEPRKHNMRLRIQICTSHPPTLQELVFAPRPQARCGFVVHTRAISGSNETVATVIADNLLITAEGALKISDFGLATLLGVKARAIG